MDKKEGGGIRWWVVGIDAVVGVDTEDRDIILKLLSFYDKCQEDDNKAKSRI